MAKFQYQILIGQAAPGTPSAVTWYRASDKRKLGSNLFAILNNYGSRGWEIVGVGDLGFDAHAEIVLKKQVE